MKDLVSVKLSLVSTVARNGLSFGESHCESVLSRHADEVLVPVYFDSVSLQRYHTHGHKS
jgi:hypothetical protein